MPDALAVLTVMAPEFVTVVVVVVVLALPPKLAALPAVPSPAPGLDSSLPKFKVWLQSTM